ncbi:type II 3-dehydroquinate dehydratase [Cochleicola gelatinilyticus]|uniref:3-dehydroquinate dehydratase n=1 Tax=Cochleicola gelatinilyticus TaxID=1763537 RepID=A0A167H336_9FLAO|nr:type II 3-dehydroquinate dehydratase [Cochleicola gelatinilyticus]OAB78165.1 3-dehydroquinate dehydratase [Cochleicola gelatinilyticus]
MKIMIINGPNLNLLGKRENDIYGDETFNDFFTTLQFKYKEVELSQFQSNIEGELIDKIQEVGYTYQGIILNAAAYTHTSVGIADAVKAIQTPVVEVHISNTYKREEFRHKSFVAPNTKGVIVGFGLQSYELALQSFLTEEGSDGILNL